MGLFAFLQARNIYERLVMVHREAKNWIKYARFETKLGQVREKPASHSISSLYEDLLYICIFLDLRRFFLGSPHLPFHFDNHSYTYPLLAFLSCVVGHSASYRISKHARFLSGPWTSSGRTISTLLSLLLLPNMRKAKKRCAA